MNLCECGCGEPAPLAARNHQGYRKGEPRRFVKNHRQRLKQRWEARECGYETPCHVFLGAKDGNGYGHVERSRNGELKAHRDAYVERNGKIPTGMVIHHLCENRSCINTEHLLCMTDAEHRRLHRPTHCKRGHEFTPENTLDNGQGMRKCRACHYEIVKRYHERIGRTCHSRKVVA